MSRLFFREFRIHPPDQKPKNPEQSWFNAQVPLFALSLALVPPTLSRVQKGSFSAHDLLVKVKCQA
jgi:hypothetical protein